MPVLKTLAALVAASAVAAAEPDDHPLESATSTHLDRADLDHEPHLTPSDLVRYLPGVYAMLVAGGGQADRLLVRGYDARQGADVAVIVDDVPINAPGHAEDHGYADTHFLIADAVAAVALHEGPYAARYGDFATTGVLELRTLDEVPGGGAQVRLTSGSELAGPVFHRRLRRLYYRLTGLASPELPAGKALLAAEVGIADGPYTNPQRMRRGAMLGTWTLPITRGELRTQVAFFSGRWTDSGLLPEHEVLAGRLGAYSAEDPSQGGTAMRASASFGVTTRDPRNGTWHLGGYVVSSSHRIFTNPSVFARDPDAGDQLEHVDDRTAYGADGYYVRAHRWGAVRGRLRIGVQARADDARAELWHDERRHRIATCFEVDNPCTLTNAHVRDIAVYAEDTLARGPVAISPGVRIDQLTWDDEDLDPETATTPASLTATAARARLSPKLGVSIAANDALDVLVRGGGGFRSSDTRATAASGAIRAIPRVWAIEAGIAVHPDPRVRAAATVYDTWQDAEVAWLPDLAQAVAVPATKRYGIETRLNARPTRWLTLDGSLSIARRASAAPVGLAAEVAPLVPELIGSAGATAFRSSTYVALRASGLTARIANTTEEASNFVLSLVAGHRWRSFEFDVELDNVTNRDWRELELAGTVQPSRVAMPTQDVLFTPGAPLTVFVTIGYLAL